MEIIKKDLKFKNALVKRAYTDKIIFHHAAMKGSIEDIHKLHIDNGWAGCGYHFYIRYDGSIYEGRPVEMVGAHAIGFNSGSIGVCFEGNFEEEVMGEKQKKAGRDLYNYLYKIYRVPAYRHGELMSTLCPGKHFPFDEITTLKKISDEIKEMVSYLKKESVLSDTALWEKKCTDDKNVYWICRKMANRLKGGDLNEKVV